MTACGQCPFGCRAACAGGVSQGAQLPTPVLQRDTHIAELSVRETLDFAARVQGVGHKRQVLLLHPSERLPNGLPSLPLQAILYMLHNSSYSSTSAVIGVCSRSKFLEHRADVVGVLH